MLMEDINKRIGLMFHHFHNENVNNYAQGSCSESGFERIISYYKNRLQKKPNRWLLDVSKENNIVLTFDDNLLSQYEIAVPVLNKYDIKGCFFVYSGVYSSNPPILEFERYFKNICFNTVDEFNYSFIGMYKRMVHRVSISEIKNNILENNYLSQFDFYTESDRIYRYIRDEIISKDEYEYIIKKNMLEKKFSIESNKLFMSLDQIKSIHKQGHIIGIHSHTHPTNMANFSYTEQLSEYEKCKFFLENLLDSEVSFASYPNGSYDKSTLSVMNELNIDLAFRSSPNVNNSLKINENLEIDRIDYSLIKLD